MNSAARQHDDAPEPVGDIDLANAEGTEYATRGAHARRHARPNLRLVSPLRPERATRGVFILFLTGLLGVGLIAILVINTALAQGAFQLSELQQEQGAIAEQAAALTQAVDAASTPGALEAKARAVGMRPSENPVFLRLPDGTILGNPKPAPGRLVSGAAALATAALGTPADATALEAVSGDAVGTDLPIAPGENYDPATADAGKATKPGKGKGTKNENSMWAEVPIAVGNMGTDVGLVAEPVN